MERIKFGKKCQKHPSEKLEYIKINHSQTSKKYHPFFLCLICKNQDDTIDLRDYQNIKYLIKSNPNQILRKWPPIKTESLIDKLIQITSNKKDNNQNINNSHDIVQDAILFFQDFKKQVIQTIDQKQKEMIQLAQQFSIQIGKNEVVSRYQEISQIEELKSELLNTQTTREEQERICKEIIQSSQSQQNTELLQSLLSDLYQKNIFDRYSAIQQQQSILNSINTIQLFKTNPVLPFDHTNQIELELIKTNRGDAQTCLEVGLNNKNQPYVENIQSNNYFHNAVSSIILDPNINYLFRFQFNNLTNENNMYIGLISDQNKHTKKIQDEKLCCELQFKNNVIFKAGNHGIHKQIQGQQFILSEENQVEMRINIKERVLEMLDFPHYQYKIGLADKCTTNLITGQDFRLCLGLYYVGNSITLTDAMTVQNFQ